GLERVEFVARDRRGTELLGRRGEVDAELPGGRLRFQQLRRLRLGPLAAVLARRVGHAPSVRGRAYPEAMPRPLVAALVPGVTPGKWERTWRERRPGARLELVPMAQDAARAALEERRAHLALVRDVAADETWHAIQLYREHPVVVAPRGSLVAALDAVDVADLADEHVLPVDLAR